MHSTYETNSTVVSLTRALENHPIPTFVTSSLRDCPIHTFKDMVAKVHR